MPTRTPTPNLTPGGRGFLGLLPLEILLGLGHVVDEEYVHAPIGETALLLGVVDRVYAEEVASLVDRWLSAGKHQVEWDGTNSQGEPLASGVYFYRLETPEQTESRKMIMMK